MCDKRDRPYPKQQTTSKIRRYLTLIKNLNTDLQWKSPTVRKEMWIEFRSVDEI